MIRRLLFFLFIASPGLAQDFKQFTLTTTINEVTVFLQGAQVFHNGTVSIPEGKSIITIERLSPYLDEKSIQVKGEGDFTILSVNHSSNHLNQLHKDRKIDSLHNLIVRIEKEMVTHTDRSEVLEEKLSLLNVNKGLGGTTAGVQLQQLKEALAFYETEITAIKKEKSAIHEKITSLKEEKNKLELQINEASVRKDLPSSEIKIRVEAKAKTTGTFTLSYVVQNAGWFPKYDVRVKDVSSPVELRYKAEVYQNTGVDWSNVKLKLSNGDPNQSGLIPELSAWYLDFHRNTIYGNQRQSLTSIQKVTGKVMGEDGLGLPGVNVIVKGTTIGTVTDVNGNYSITLPNNASTLTFSYIGYVSEELSVTSPTMNLQLQPNIAQLNEVVATGYAGRLEGKAAGVVIQGTSSSPISTTVIENQTTVEFEVPMPYSVKSTGEKIMVDLQQHSIDAAYEYYAVPKLDKDAFLVAKIINWDQYQFLEGEANLYFEDAFVGTTILEAKALTDTLNISLGRDKNIIIGREPVKEFSKKKTIGSNKIETREVKITVRNKKSQPIKITLADQVPISVNGEITVSPGTVSEGRLEESTGIVKWEFNLEGQQQKELKFGYEVKYPKYENVVLE